VIATTTAISVFTARFTAWFAAIFPFMAAAPRVAATATAAFALAA
jgi:hypothetical protein